MTTSDDTQPFDSRAEWERLCVSGLVLAPPVDSTAEYVLNVLRAIADDRSSNPRLDAQAALDVLERKTK